MIIRAMTSEDYPAVYAIWKETEGIGLGASDTKEAITSFLERNPGLSMVAVIDNDIIGAVLCGHDGRRGYLHHLAVSPKYQRQRIATTMLAHVYALLSKLGIEKCNLFLFTDNHVGEQFWIRNEWIIRNDLKILQRKRDRYNKDFIIIGIPLNCKLKK